MLFLELFLFCRSTKQRYKKESYTNSIPEIMSFRHKNGLPEDVRNDVWRAYHSVSYFTLREKCP